MILVDMESEFDDVLASIIQESSIGAGLFTASDLHPALFRMEWTTMAFNPSSGQPSSLNWHILLPIDRASQISAPSGNSNHFCRKASQPDFTRPSNQSSVKSATVLMTAIPSDYNKPISSVVLSSSSTQGHSTLRSKKPGSSIQAPDKWKLFIRQGHYSSTPRRKLVLTRFKIFPNDHIDPSPFDFSCFLHIWTCS